MFILNIEGSLINLNKCLVIKIVEREAPTNDKTKVTKYYLRAYFTSVEFDDIRAFETKQDAEAFKEKIYNLMCDKGMVIEI